MTAIVGAALLFVWLAGIFTGRLLCPVQSAHRPTPPPAPRGRSYDEGTWYEVADMLGVPTHDYDPKGRT